MLSDFRPSKYKMNIFLFISLNNNLLKGVNDLCCNFMCGIRFGIDMHFVLLKSAAYKG